MSENNEAVTALKDIALASLKEQRSARRWGIFFKLSFLAYVLIFLMAISGNISEVGQNMTDAEEITAVVDINGIIMERC